LCVPFVWRSLHFFGMSFISLFPFFLIIKFITVKLSSIHFSSFLRTNLSVRMSSEIFSRICSSITKKSFTRKLNTKFSSSSSSSVNGLGKTPSPYSSNSSSCLWSSLYLDVVMGYTDGLISVVLFNPHSLSTVSNYFNIVEFYHV